MHGLRPLDRSHGRAGDIAPCHRRSGLPIVGQRIRRRRCAPRNHADGPAATGGAEDTGGVSRSTRSIPRRSSRRRAGSRWSRRRASSASAVSARASHPSSPLRSAHRRRSRCGPIGDPFARQVAHRTCARSASCSIASATSSSSTKVPASRVARSARSPTGWKTAAVPASHIAFLSSHAGAPGPRASERHRDRWNAAQRVPADLSGQLPALLRSWLAPLVGRHRRTRRTSPAVNGAGMLYSNEAAWAAATPAWERRKYLARAGDRTWTRQVRRPWCDRRAQAGDRARAPLGAPDAGAGRACARLSRRTLVRGTRRLAAGEKPIGEIAVYLGARARLLPARESDGAGLAQLLEMARRNVALALGPGAASQLERWSGRLDALSRRVSRMRSDNKLEPHEWLRTADDRLLKTDALDHHAAHDLVGCQDLRLGRSRR